MEKVIAIIVGQRYELKNNVERYPHFFAAQGRTGIILEARAGYIALQMEEPLQGAEYWNNCIIWETPAAFEADTQPTTQPTHIDKQTFLAALQMFKEAADNLSAAFEVESNDGTIGVESYPNYLPSFDDFAHDVQQWYNTQRQKLG